MFSPPATPPEFPFLFGGTFIEATEDEVREYVSE